MKKRINKGVFNLVVLLIFLGIFLGIDVAAVPAAEEKVSAPGQYNGYSPVLYDGHKVFSQYVAVRDGTKLAVDIIRPTKNGLVAEEPLPVVKPVKAVVRTESNRKELTAFITFPKALDPRYIKDVKTKSIKCNGIKAQSATVDGNTVVAVFKKKKLSKDGILKLKGEFGEKYNYGNMTFTAVGAMP